MKNVLRKACLNSLVLISGQTLYDPTLVETFSIEFCDRWRTHILGFAGRDLEPCDVLRQHFEFLNDMENRCIALSNRRMEPVLVNFNQQVAQKLFEGRADRQESV